MEAIITAMIVATANMHGIEPRLALAIAHVESNLNPNAISSKGAVGVMQIRQLAFPQYSIKQLKNLKTNITLGVKHLVYMRRVCNFKYNNTWVVCYNRGAAGTLRDVRNPYTENYYKKVMKEYKRLYETKTH